MISSIERKIDVTYVYCRAAVPAGATLALRHVTQQTCILSDKLPVTARILMRVTPVRKLLWKASTMCFTQTRKVFKALIPCHRRTDMAVLQGSVFVLKNAQNEQNIGRYIFVL